MSGTTSDKPIARQPGAAVPDSTAKPATSAPTGASSSADKSAPALCAAIPPKTSAASPVAPGAASATPAAQKTVKCPKCGTDVREVARFCQRCHHTMRYECPSCHNQQRTGGKCEKCGIDFLKYVGAVVTQKQAEADIFHERIEQRSTLMKNILWMPFTLGFPIIRDYFVKRDRKK
ncbi:MAG: zinc-ribbon domain-containing protein [Candidatus Acidiferrales bacterium]